MRLALLQIRIRPGARSANLAHALRRVVRAAETDPPPDLIVLPAWCDGHSGGEVSEAMAQGFSESLAAAAREWGVYLAAGSLQVSGQSAFERARLYDPDGDVIARSTKAAARQVAETSLGRLAVCLGRKEGPAELPRVRCDMLLVLGRWTAGPKDRRRVARRLETRLGRLARRTAAVVCGVGPVTEPAADKGSLCIGGTAAYGPDGRCLAAAGDRADRTVVVEVRPPAQARTDRPAKM